MTKVIVTGAGGFLGRHCLPLLQAGFDEVHAVSSKEIQATDSHVHWHAADLLDPKQTRDLLADIRATHLLHLATLNSIGIDIHFADTAIQSEDARYLAAEAYNRVEELLQSSRVE